MMEKPKIILASGSPRRSELLTLAGVPFTVVVPDICETPLPDELPVAHVERLSLEKAAAASMIAEGHFFIAADTVVVLDDQIIGKPLDEDHAFRMLSSLSGRTHQVITGFTIYDASSKTATTASVITDVTFKILDQSEISAYIKTGCPMDKAGSYAIQGGAVHFVRSINGSYSNVVGLPMTELYETLQKLNVI